MQYLCASLWLRFSIIIVASDSIPTNCSPYVLEAVPRGSSCTSDILYWLFARQTDAPTRSAERAYVWKAAVKHFIRDGGTLPDFSKAYDEALWDRRLLHEMNKDINRSLLSIQSVRERDMRRNVLRTILGGFLQGYFPKWVFVQGMDSVVEALMSESWMTLVDMRQTMHVLFFVLHEDMSRSEPRESGSSIRRIVEYLGLTNLSESAPIHTSFMSTFGTALHHPAFGSRMIDLMLLAGRPGIAAVYVTLYRRVRQYLASNPMPETHNGLEISWGFDPIEASWQSPVTGAAALGELFTEARLVYEIKKIDLQAILQIGGSSFFELVTDVFMPARRLGEDSWRIHRYYDRVIAHRIVPHTQPPVHADDVRMDPRTEDMLTQAATRAGRPESIKAMRNVVRRFIRLGQHFIPEGAAILSTLVFREIVDKESLFALAWILIAQEFNISESECHRLMRMVLPRACGTPPGGSNIECPLFLPVTRSDLFSPLLRERMVDISVTLGIAGLLAFWKAAIDVTVTNESAESACDLISADGLLQFFTREAVAKRDSFLYENVAKAYWINHPGWQAELVAPEMSEDGLSGPRLGSLLPRLFAWYEGSCEEFFEVRSATAAQIEAISPILEMLDFRPCDDTNSASYVSTYKQRSLIKAFVALEGIKMKITCIYSDGPFSLELSRRTYAGSFTRVDSGIRDRECRSMLSNLVKVEIALTILKNRSEPKNDKLELRDEQCIDTFVVPTDSRSAFESGLVLPCEGPVLPARPETLVDVEVGCVGTSVAIMSCVVKSPEQTTTWSRIFVPSPGSTESNTFAQRVCGTSRANIDDFIDGLKADCAYGENMLTENVSRNVVKSQDNPACSARNGFEDHLVKTPSGAYVSSIPLWRLRRVLYGGLRHYELPGESPRTFRGLGSDNGTCESRVEIINAPKAVFRSALEGSILSGLDASCNNRGTEEALRNARTALVKAAPVVDCNSQFVQVRCLAQIRDRLYALSQRARITDMPHKHPFVSRFINDVATVKKQGVLCKSAGHELLKASLDECYLMVSSLINYL